MWLTAKASMCFSTLHVMDEVKLIKFKLLLGDFEKFIESKVDTTGCKYKILSYAALLKFYIEI